MTFLFWASPSIKTLSSMKVLVSSSKALEVKVIILENHGELVLPNEIIDLA
jgi:hypothetical protein